MQDRGTRRYPADGEINVTMAVSITGPVSYSLTGACIDDVSDTIAQLLESRDYTTITYNCSDDIKKKIEEAIYARIDNRNTQSMDGDVSESCMSQILNDANASAAAELLAQWRSDAGRKVCRKM